MVLFDRVLPVDFWSGTLHIRRRTFVVDLNRTLPSLPSGPPIFDKFLAYKTGQFDFYRYLLIFYLATVYFNLAWLLTSTRNRPDSHGQHFRHLWCHITKYFEFSTMSVSLIASISEQPNDNHFNPSSVFSNDRNKISDVSITINNEYGYFMTSFFKLL